LRSHSTRVSFPKTQHVFRNIVQILSLVFLFQTALFAANGTLTFILLKEGKPLQGSEVVIDDDHTFTTDSDGYVNVPLSSGTHQLQVIGRQNNQAIVYAKKTFEIMNAENTQVIMTLNRENSMLLDDVETPKQEATISLSTQSLPKGTLTLHIVASEDKKAIAGARIFVKGFAIEGRTDANGTYTLELPQGEQTLSIIHGQFSSQTIKSLITANEHQSKNIEMTPSSLELEEFVVLVPNISGSIASVIAEQRNSDAVGDVLGSEQFSKSGDGDVASALKRASGLTIVGGKYVYVRGLGDRYSTIMFNDLYVPSPNPTKRVVPLDIFPTSVVKSITIQKAYTADLPGSFAGGTILINSIDIPQNEGFVKAEVELKVNDATGSKVIQNSDNTKGIPSSVISASQHFNEIYLDPAITQAVANYRTYDHQESTLPPGYKLSLSGGKSIDTDWGIQFGVTGSVFMQNEADQSDVYYDKYVYNNTDKKHQLEEQTARSITSYEEKLGGLISLGMESSDNSLKYTLFNMKQTSNSTTTGSTTFVGSAYPYDLTYYEYLEEEIMLHQFNGEHNIKFSNDTEGYFNNIIIKWAAETGTATREEPGTVEYQYDHIYQAPTLNKKIWYLYGDLEDKVKNYRIDLSLPFTLNEQDNSTDIGFFQYNKERTLDNRRFKMQHSFSNNDPILEGAIDSVLNDTYLDQLAFSTNYRPDDAYEATQDLNAFYLKQLLSITKAFDIVASVRYESSKQELIDVKTGKPYEPLKTDDWLPGIGMTYRLNDAMQFRLAYSNTITRPDFREFSPNRFKDPVTSNIIFGNPNLKQTNIANYDIKYEWYMSPDELFSFALFKKDFINPIETIQAKDVQSDAAVQLVSYRNADSANSYGFELDLRKRFDFIDKSLESLVLSSNVTYINSDVKISRDSQDEMLANLSTTKRSMMGQSPYVINITLGYDDKETGNSSLFLFNEIGERLVALGTYGNADKYEQPFEKLDFVAKWKFNNNHENKDALTYAMKLKAENLLDSEVTVTQAGHNTYYYKPGQAYSISFSVAY
jgi:outer membrane receptor protein involved in Fe transport